VVRASRHLAQMCMRFESVTVLHAKANRSIKLTHTEAQRHIRDAKQKTGMFVLVRTEALRIAGYAPLCGNGFLTLVHRHLL
jgi:hypothetical protein